MYRVPLRFTATRSAKPVLGSVIATRWLSSTKGKLSTTATEVPPHKVAASPNPDKYLDSYTTPELVGYGAIGLATSSKLVLDAVVKLFPYCPIWLMKLLVSKNYCGGDNLEEMRQTAERLSKRGIKNMMVSYTVEACDGRQMSVSIEKIVEETKKSVTDLLVPHTIQMISEAGAGHQNEIPPGYVALKPTGLIEGAADILLHYKEEAYQAKYQKLFDTCAEIIEEIEQHNIRLHKQIPGRHSPFIVAIMDAERNDLQQAVYKLQRDLMAKFNKTEATVVGTMQMYLKESTPNLLKEDELARKGGYKLGWKLVRGAYIHTEPDRGVIHDTKADTDANYNAGIKRALKNLSSENPTVGHLVVASHNPDTQRMATDLLSSIASEEARANVVLGQLLGMADNVTYDLIQNRGVKNIIKYVPWGPPQETKFYLQRRLEENGDAVRADSGLPLFVAANKALLKRAI